MANYSALKAAIQAVIKTNGAHEITGANMQATLLSIIDSLGNGYQLMGVATPSTTPPSSPDYNIAYIAGAGSYTNFGTAVVIPPTNIAIFKYDGSWACEQVTVENGGVFDITAYNNNTTYADLAAALGTGGANVPESVRKGGMSIKFVQSSDNKYLKFFCTADAFTTDVTQWQGVENVPTAGSDNLVKSGGVFDSFMEGIKQQIAFVNGEYINKYNGAITPYEGWSRTNYLCVLGIKELDYINNGDSSAYNAFYDKDKNFISSFTVNSSGSINIPDNAVWCVFSNTTASISGLSITNLPIFNGEINRVDYPMFGRKNIVSDYFAGQMYGYPYLIPTQDQFENELTLNALHGLSLEGLDNTKKYYLKFNHSSTTHFIDIYEESQTNILARGTIGTSDSLILIEELNNSGVTGKAKLHFTDAALLINTYTLINTHSVVINANHIETLENKIAYLQNNVFGGSLKELYFEGLNQNSEYRIRAYKGNSYTQFQVFLGSGTSNIVAAGTISGNPSKLDDIFELSPVNSSNIHGYIYFEGDNIAATTDRGVINNAVVSDMENSPSIKKYEEDNPVIVSSERGYSPSLLRGIMKAETFMDKKVIVDAGTYDLEAEFKEYYGNDFFTNYTYDATNLGIHLKNRVHVIFSSGAKVVFNYSGDNADIKRYFSPFNAMPASSDCYGFTLENLTLEASNCRYCVHDERNANTDSYTNKYINCHMKIDNTNNSYGYNCCIGGGLGKNGYIEVMGCRFESADIVNVGALVSWHNSSHANAKSKIVCHNNYIEGKGTFRFTWHGTSTLITEVLVDGNSLAANVIVEAETGSDTIVNVNVTQWNNEIRA